MADKIVQLKDKGDNLYPIGVGGYNVYSTSEAVIGKWINGKPIYRRVFQFDRGSSSSSGWVVKTFSPSIDFEDIVGVNGAVKNVSGSETSWYPITRVRQSNTPYEFGLSTIWTSSMAFDIGTSLASTWSTAYVVLDYTKQ